MICGQKCHLVRRDYVCKHICGFDDCVCYEFFINFYTNFLKNNIKAKHSETLEEIPINIDIWHIKFYKHYKGNIYTTLGFNDEYMFYTNTENTFWARPINNFKEEIEINNVKIKRFKQL